MYIKNVKKQFAFKQIKSKTQFKYTSNYDFLLNIDKKMGPRCPMLPSKPCLTKSLILMKLSQ